MHHTSFSQGSVHDACESHSLTTSKSLANIDHHFIKKLHSARSVGMLNNVTYDKNISTDIFNSSSHLNSSKFDKSIALKELEEWISKQESVEKFRKYLKSKSICTWALDFYVASTGVRSFSSNDARLKEIAKVVCRRYLKKIPSIVEQTKNSRTDQLSLSDEASNSTGLYNSTMPFPIRSETLFHINTKISNKDITVTLFDEARTDVLNWLLPDFISFQKHLQTFCTRKNTISIKDKTYDNDLSETNPPAFARLVTLKLNELLAYEGNDVKENVQETIDLLNTNNKCEKQDKKDDELDLLLDEKQNEILTTIDLSAEIGCADGEQLLDEHCARVWEKNCGTNVDIPVDKLVDDMNKPILTELLTSQAMKAINRVKVDKQNESRSAVGKKKVVKSSNNKSIPDSTSKRSGNLKHSSRSVVYHKEDPSDISTQRRLQRTVTLSAIDSDFNRLNQNMQSRPVWRRQRSQNNLNRNEKQSTRQASNRNHTGLPNRINPEDSGILSMPTPSTLRNSTTRRSTKPCIKTSNTHSTITQKSAFEIPTDRIRKIEETAKDKRIGEWLANQQNQQSISSYSNITVDEHLKQTFVADSSTAGKSITVVYYLPGQDVPYMTQGRFKDDSKITLNQLKQIVQYKRISNCRYFFKVKTDLTDSGIVYQEVSEPNDIIPLFENKIITKIERRD